VQTLRLLLFPFAVLYDAITSIRNSLYNQGYKPVAQFDIPVIGVGNLAIGGTGKTPMVEYLIRLFSPQCKVATLSRGYGRKTRGVRIATDKDDASTIGDEPYQLHKKFDGRIKVTVGEERALAIPYIVDEFPDTQVIILDDAFQHRKVKATFHVVLSDYHNLFFKDLLLPAGKLRESARGIQRADAIVVTKCPFHLEEEEMMHIERSIRDYADKPIFFSAIRYGNPIALDRDDTLSASVILVSGIANHTPLENYVRHRYTLIKHFAFPDHHAYTAEELKMVTKEAKKAGAMILTTEKDAVKIDTPVFKPVITGVSCFYLPIEAEFLKNGKEFDEMLLNTLNRHDS
jgi:tetraacyldisaccharide 4'-kinase